MQRDIEYAKKTDKIYVKKIRNTENTQQDRLRI